MPHGQNGFSTVRRGRCSSQSSSSALEARGVRPPEHRELGLEQQIAEGAGVEELAEGPGEEPRVLVHPEDPDAARIVHVLVEDRVQPRALERAHQRLGVQAAAEGLQLHEQPTLGVLAGAALADVDPLLFAAAHR